MSRNRTVDCLKAYACLLVVFGHVIMGIRKMGGVVIPAMAYSLENFLWTYHVAIFMFLSGCVYGITGKWEKKKTRRDYIAYKAVNLGIPYFFFSTVYIFINSCIPGTNHDYSMQDILSIGIIPVAQYWYLYALFVVFCLYVIFSYWLNDILITVLLTFLNCLLLILNIDVPVLSQGLSWVFAFGLGLIAYKVLNRMYSTRMVFLFIIFHILFEAVCFKLEITGKPVVSDFEKALGIITSVVFISGIIRISTIRECLLIISKYSFQIYLLHTFFTAGVRIMFIKLGIHSYLAHVLAGMLAGVAIPMLIVKVTAKMGLFNFFFFPTATISKWKRTH